MALDKEKVVRTGLGLLDEVGLDGLTLRRLATELGVQAPALYWHFENKQQLLDEMATTMVRDLVGDALSEAESWTWEDWLAWSGRGLRLALLSKRDGARMFAGTYLTDDSMLTGMEGPLAAMHAAGFPVVDAARAFMTVYAYTIGFTIEEQAVQGDPRYDDSERRARLDTDAYPLTAAAGPAIFGQSPDERFEHGLGLIVAGVRATQL